MVVMVLWGNWKSSSNLAFWDNYSNCFMKKLLQIDKLLKFSRTITFVALGVTLFSVMTCLLYVFYVNKTKRQIIYVLNEKGQAFSAKIIDDELMYREPEIYSHLKIFHNYFFNLDQFNYEMNLEKALELIDDSGKNYYLTLLNDGWYNSLKLNNLVQEINFDSIKINTEEYPYLSSLYGKTSVYRHGENNRKKEKTIEIRCELYNVARTMGNPHGLLISNYNIINHGKE